MTTKRTAKRGVKALGHGRYLLRLYVAGRDHLRTVDAKSTTEAQSIRHQLMKQLRLEIEQPSRKRVSGAAVAWLDRKKAAKRPDGSARLAPTTLDRYANAIEKHIVPILGEYQVDGLAHAIIRDWRDSLAEQYAASTVNGHLRALKAFLADVGSKAAERITALEEDDTRITDDEPNLLTASELRAFLAAARESVHFSLVLFLVTTGCRISTARAVRWEDIDAAAGVVHLRRRLSKKETLPGVKRSRRSKDVAPLLPGLLSLLEKRRAAFSEKQRASGLVFPAPRTGGPLARSVLDKPFDAWLAKAKISKRFTPHGLRRTAALAYRLAASSSLAMDVLGHTTDEMHRHYAPSQAAEKVAAAERAFGDLLRVEDGDLELVLECKTLDETGT